MNAWLQGLLFGPTQLAAAAATSPLRQARAQAQAPASTPAPRPGDANFIGPTAPAAGASVNILTLLLLGGVLWFAWQHNQPAPRRRRRSRRR